MRLDLVAHSPDVEALIATAMLTTTSGTRPSKLFQRLLKNPGKVREIVRRLEPQHGSVLEHNRFTWVMEASNEKVLEALLASKFFDVSPLGAGRWLMSANLRAVIEYSAGRKEALAEALISSLKGIIPSVKVVQMWWR